MENEIKVGAGHAGGKQIEGSSEWGMAKRIVKKYTNDFLGTRKRAKEESVLSMQGYKVIEEEEIKEWQAGNACCLALIFLPLIFIKTKMIKVTYER